MQQQDDMRSVIDALNAPGLGASPYLEEVAKEQLQFVEYSGWCDTCRKTFSASWRFPIFLATCPSCGDPMSLYPTEEYEARRTAATQEA